MNPIQSITTCLRKYFQFSGRASRSEYWWFFAATSIAVYGTMAARYEGLSTLLWLATIVPWLAVSWRRLHDSDLAGPWLFLPAIMLVISLYGFMFSILFAMMPHLEAMMPSIEMTDDTTLGELRGAMSEQIATTPFEQFDLSAGNVIFLILGISSAVLAIYFKIRPSDPGPNRFGPNPTEVPS